MSGNPNAPLHLDSIVARAGGVISAEIDEEIAMLDIERGMCFGLNNVGSRVWGLIEAPVRIRDLCSKLTVEYEVDQSDCERQILDLLEELRAEGLVRAVSD